jgi:hypothetical protein
MTDGEILSFSQYSKEQRNDADKMYAKLDSCKLSINTLELWDKKNVNHFNNSVLFKII